MKKGPGRLFIVVFLAVGALLTIAIAITIQKTKEAYTVPQHTPSWITQNYLMALQQKDYVRAYSHLVETCKLPQNYDQFVLDIMKNTGQFRLNQSPFLSISSYEIDGKSARVVVKESNLTSGSLFASDQNTNSFDVYLVIQDGDWKIIESGLYFDSEWDCH